MISAKANSFTGGLSVRATIDNELQPIAATGLQRQLESYDRSQGIWHGTGKTIPVDQLGDEVTWREALSNIRIARDIRLENEWYPAVVLEVGQNEARLGIESVEEDEDGHWVPAKDVQWAQKRNSDGSLAKKARVAGDLVAVGEVVHVRRLTADNDGSFIRWTLRQVPKCRAVCCYGCDTGRVIAMQGGFSYQASVFNRATQAKRQPGSSFKPFVYAAALDSGYTPATIVVDAPIEINTPQGLWRPRNSSEQILRPNAAAHRDRTVT